jgi:hypothetical protein
MDSFFIEREYDYTDQKDRLTLSKKENNTISVRIDDLCGHFASIDVEIIDLLKTLYLATTVDDAKKKEKKKAGG